MINFCDFHNTNAKIKNFIYFYNIKGENKLFIKNIILKFVLTYQSVLENVIRCSEKYHNEKL